MGGKEVWAKKWWMMGQWLRGGRPPIEEKLIHMVAVMGKVKSLNVWVGVRGFCWGVLPVREGEGDPGQRGSWQGGPLSSSPPPVPGSAVQTAPPAPWLTPAEPLRSHTAPYTLHSPEGKEGHYTQPLGFLSKACTHFPTKSPLHWSSHTLSSKKGLLQRHIQVLWGESSWDGWNESTTMGLHNRIWPLVLLIMIAQHAKSLCRHVKAWWQTQRLPGFSMNYRQAPYLLCCIYQTKSALMVSMFKRRISNGLIPNTAVKFRFGLQNTVQILSKHFLLSRWLFQTRITPSK